VKTAKLVDERTSLAASLEVGGCLCGPSGGPNRRRGRCLCCDARRLRALTPAFSPLPAFLPLPQADQRQLTQLREAAASFTQRADKARCGAARQPLLQPPALQAPAFLLPAPSLNPRPRRRCLLLVPPPSHDAAELEAKAAKLAEELKAARAELGEKRQAAKDAAAQHRQLGCGARGTGLGPAC
jgi:hypothetical protein